MPIQWWALIYSASHVLIDHHMRQRLNLEQQLSRLGARPRGYKTTEGGGMVARAATGTSIFEMQCEVQLLSAAEQLCHSPDKLSFLRSSRVGYTLAKKP
jgi:hypothetical protein